ncbi:MAG: hypothetical protein AAGA55_10610 [Planctomycetota bacterium]
MRALILQIAPAVRLARVSTAFGAVAGVWLTILWTRSVPQEAVPRPIAETPLWLLLGGGVLAGGGLYGFGAGLNDLLDAHRDRVLRPTRPIAGGALPPEAGVTIVACSLLLSVLGATVFGTPAVLAMLFLAAAILVFNALGKFIPAVGVLLLSVIYAGHAIVPNLSITFVIPAWWVMTHALIIAGLAHWLGRKSPAMSRRAIVFALIGWLGCSAGLGWLAWGRLDGHLWPSWVPWGVLIWPSAASAMLALQIARRTRALGAGPKLGEKITRYGSFWPTLYGFGWLAGVGAWRSAAILGGLAGAGLLTLTVLRELYALSEHPVGYRL